MLAAVRTGERAHVLHDAEDGHVQALEHADGLAHVEQRHVLGRGDHHHAAQGQHLRERELGVAGAGRHVEDHVIERAPHDVLEHLLDERVDHRPPPHDRLALVHEQADRHQLETMRLDRNDLVVEHPGLALGAEHQRHVGAVHVAVDEPDGDAALTQRQREVDRDGRLADAALAGRDRDGVAHLGDQVRRRRAGRAVRLGVGVALLGGRGRVAVRGRRWATAHLHLHASHTGNLPEQPRGHTVHRRLGGGRLTGEGQRQRHPAGVDREVAHEAERHDVLLGLGIADAAERVEDLLLGGHIPGLYHPRLARTGASGKASSHSGRTDAQAHAAGPRECSKNNGGRPGTPIAVFPGGRL